MTNLSKPLGEFNITSVFYWIDLMALWTIDYGSWYYLVSFSPSVVDFKRAKWMKIIEESGFSTD